MKYKIGDIVDIIDGDRGRNYPKQDEFFNSGYCLFLDTGNVRRDGFSFEETHFITEEKCNALRKGKMQRGDIAYTTRGTVGNAAYFNDSVPFEHIRINSGMVILRAKSDKVISSFLYQLLKHDSCRTYIKGYCTGSAQPQLPIKNFSQIEIDIPSLAQQERISSVITAYDSLIENNQKQIKLLEEAAQRLYKEWFVDLHFPGYENTPVVDGVPEGWEYRTLSSFGNIITGKTPATSKTDNYGDSVPFVKIPDMHGNIYPIRTELMLSDTGAESQRGKFIPPRSLLVSCIATVGLVNITIERCQTNQQINALIPNNCYNLYYLYFAIRDKKETLIAIGSNGATMTNVNKEKFGKVKVLYSSEELVKEYNAFTTDIFEKVLRLSKSIIHLQNARDILLPKLMSEDIEGWEHF